MVVMLYWQKLDTRIEISRYMAQHGETEPVQEVGLYLCELVSHLGLEGMSSESSEEDQERWETVLHVHDLPWRNATATLQLVYLDMQRRKTSIYSRRGAKPLHRIRPKPGPEEGRRITERPAPRRRPRGIYHKDWLEAQRKQELSDLDIDEEVRFEIREFV